jgi:sugar phosphate isomerase/epimerase
MSKKIAVQLYSVREEIKKDFDAMIEAIAEMGYAGVEPAGFVGFGDASPAQAAARFRELGLAVPSAHCGLPVGEDANRILDLAETLGARRVIGGIGADQYATLDQVRANCEAFNEAAARAATRGMTFGIHNHWWEFGEIDGQPIFDVMLERLAPEVFFQIDTYWVAVAGQDPAAIIRRVVDRAPCLHIKDGPCVKDEPMTAVGAGKMNFPPIVAAAERADWLIVELDHCATDMMQAVRESIDFLVGANLGTRS